MLEWVSHLQNLPQPRVCKFEIYYVDCPVHFLVWTSWECNLTGLDGFVRMTFLIPFSRFSFWTLQPSHQWLFLYCFFHLFIYEYSEEKYRPYVILWHIVAHLGYFLHGIPNVKNFACFLFVYCSNGLFIYILLSFRNWHFAWNRITLVNGCITGVVQSISFLWFFTVATSIF